MSKMKKVEFGSKKITAAPLSAQEKAEKITNCLAADVNETLEISVKRLEKLFDLIVSNPIDCCPDQTHWNQSKKVDDNRGFSTKISGVPA